MYSNHVEVGFSSSRCWDGGWNVSQWSIPLRGREESKICKETSLGIVWLHRTMTWLSASKAYSQIAVCWPDTPQLGSKSYPTNYKIQLNENIRRYFINENTRMSCNGDYIHHYKREYSIFIVHYLLGKCKVNHIHTHTHKSLHSYLDD